MRSLLFMRGVLYIASSYYRPTEELIVKINTLKVYIGRSLPTSTDIGKAKMVLIKHIDECIRLSSYALTIIRNDTEKYETFKNFRINLRNFKEYIMAETTTKEDIIVRYNSAVVLSLNSTSDACFSTYGYHINDAFELTTDSTDVYKMHPDYITEIAESISSTTPINVFSIQCGEGQDELFLKDRLTRKNNVPVKTYGLSEVRYGSNKAKENMDKVALGSVKGSTITNNAFDIVYVTPRISLKTEIKQNGKLKITNEDIQITNSMRYLKPGGIFILNIPFYAITPGMKLFLAKNLKDIEVIKTTFDFETDNYAEGIRRDLCYVSVIGVRHVNSSYADIFSTLSNLEYYKLLDEVTIERTLNLPEQEIKIFRGSILDKKELDEIVLNDNLYEEFYDAVNKQNKEKDKSPLLPFNIGQIGLILSSGSLDGVVEEGHGVCHVIKGMTIKETDRNSEQITENGRVVTQTTETIRNKVQITALGADGTFYDLT